MLCKSCGADTPDEAVFCPKCGGSLQSDTAAGAPAERRPTTTEQFKGAARPRDDDDDDDEEDLWTGGYSGKAMIGSWILAAVASFCLIVATVFFPAAWLVLIPLIVLVWIVVSICLAYQKLGVHYELTTQRFIHKSGILRRVTDRIEMIDIDDVTYEQGPVQRIVGVGTIRISSSDRTHPELALYGIDDVRTVADTIDDCRRKERRRRGLHIEAV